MPDVGRTSAFVVEALTPGLGRDWSVPAGTLEWSVEFTLEHIASALSKYTLYLASRSTRIMATRVEIWKDASQQERLNVVAIAGRALANVVAASPTKARAYHASGMLDPDGYAALGCLETLVHGDDIAVGLDLPFNPPDDLVRPVVARHLPWLSADRPWETLLEHTRAPGTNDAWTIQREPLAEWDGQIPVRTPRPVAEWVLEGERWQPRYIP
jgi:hypothetical protein